jgi:hypothetical protein
MTKEEIVRELEELRAEIRTAKNNFNKFVELGGEDAEKLCRLVEINRSRLELLKLYEPHDKEREKLLTRIFEDVPEHDRLTANCRGRLQMIEISTDYAIHLRDEYKKLESELTKLKEEEERKLL